MSAKRATNAHLTSGTPSLSGQESGVGGFPARAGSNGTAHAERLGMLFEQSPSFMAVLEGPTHVIVQANPNYLR
ncbi:hypothetical protein, partial [Variovorax rhizosphaerae]|uniref:hypothetical protein n=1 Tax=Variovorax rhizosphaerae TaxID=1836200 RepID=UPI003BF494B0